MTTETQEQATTDTSEAPATPTSEKKVPRRGVKKTEQPSEEVSTPPEPSMVGLHLLKDLGLYKYDLGVKLKKDFDPTEDEEAIKTIQAVIGKRGQIFSADDARVISSIVFSPSDKARIELDDQSKASGEKSPVSSIELWRARINQQKFNDLMTKIDNWEKSHQS